MSQSQEYSFETEDPLVGKLFEGRYQIISVLGQGGMGTVYKARHVHMDKIYAIKTLVQGAVNDDNSFKRFEQEARAAASLNHPNTINVTDFGKSKEGLAFLVMEFLSGMTLEDILIESEDFMPLERFRRIFTQVCDGMQHAHKKGIIHRDLKPSNLMLIDTDEEQDLVKILDFGLAKLSSNTDTQHLTRTGMVMGSPPFMSPEQCRGDELDFRSDIYSLGCVMYASLTGQVPIRGNNSMATIYKHITDTPAPIKNLAPHVPDGLELVVMRALEKNPADRPQTMAELGKNIRAAISESSLSSDAIPAFQSFPQTDTNGGAIPATTVQDGNDATVRIKNTDRAPALDTTKVDNIPVPGSLAAPQFPGGQNATAPPLGSDPAPGLGTAQAGVSAQASRSAHGDAAPIPGTAPIPGSAQAPATAPIPGSAQAPGTAPGPVIQPGSAPAQTPGPTVVPGTNNPPGSLLQAQVPPGAPAGKVPAAKKKSKKKKAAVPAVALVLVGILVAGSSALLIMKQLRRAAPPVTVTDNHTTPEEQPTQTQTDTSATATTVGSNEKAVQQSAQPITSTAVEKPVVPAVVPIKPARPKVPPKEAKKSAGNQKTSDASRLEALKRANDLKAQADAEFASEAYDGAYSLYKSCLAEERIAYDKGDPHLLPTLVRICETAHKIAPHEEEPAMAEALDIYSNNQVKAREIIEHTERPTGSWRCLGLGCLEMSRRTTGIAKQRYARWALSFFALAHSSWTNRPKKGDDYMRMLHSYLNAATEAGDINEANRLRSEMMQTAPDLRHPPGTPPERGFDNNLPPRRNGAGGELPPRRRPLW